jgi:hypothetical protein
MKPLDEFQLMQAQATTRRQFFGGIGLGLGSIALTSLLERDGYAQGKREKGKAGERQKAKGESTPDSPLSPKPSMFAPKAKAVIYLHMAGSPSQIDLFEHKPELTKYDGKECPEEFLKGKRFAFIRGVPMMLGPLFKYQQHGQSGQWISELLPHLASKVDDICVVRSMFTEQFNHAPAQLFIHTGQPRFGYPSMGAWTTYGLGTLNQDLPGFVVLTSGGKVRGSDFGRQGSRCGQERLGERISADPLSGGAVPYRWRRSGAVSLQSGRDGQGVAPPDAGCSA